MEKLKSLFNNSNNNIFLQAIIPYKTINYLYNHLYIIQEIIYTNHQACSCNDDHHHHYYYGSYFQYLYHQLYKHHHRLIYFGLWLCGYLFVHNTYLGWFMKNDTLITSTIDDDDDGYQFKFKHQNQDLIQKYYLEQNNNNNNKFNQSKIINLNKINRLVHGDIVHFVYVNDFYIFWNIIIIESGYFFYRIYLCVDTKLIQFLISLLSSSSQHNNHQKITKQLKSQSTVTINMNNKILKLAQKILTIFQSLTLITDLSIMNIFWTFFTEIVHNWSNIYYEFFFVNNQIITSMFKFLLMIANLAAFNTGFYLFVHAHTLVSCWVICSIVHLKMRIRTTNRELLLQLKVNSNQIRQIPKQFTATTTIINNLSSQYINNHNINSQHQTSKSLMVIERFKRQNIEIMSTLFITNRLVSPLFGVYVLANFPMNAYMVMMLVLRNTKSVSGSNNIDQIQMIIIITMIIHNMCSLLGLHYQFANLSKSIHSPSKMLLSYQATMAETLTTATLLTSISSSSLSSETAESRILPKVKGSTTKATMNRKFPIIFKNNTNIRVKTLLELIIGRLYTNKRYGYHYGPVGLVSMSTIAKVKCKFSEKIY